ncbi:MAG: beta-galactosidase [Solirubrobacteraceae bacterium]|jgi:beta-glucuronidase|nr:beta-galactosidase [Solirubrobacteraceae bacterium]
MWSQVSRVLLFVLAVACALACPAGALASDPPAPVPLAQGWQYAPDPGDQGVAANWQSGRFGSAWQPTTVPHVFDPRPLPRLFNGTVGWYRVGFVGPATPAGTGWSLRFEQVRRTARVWLNGREIGSHLDPYTPFELPATGLLAGRPNLLVVRADNRRPPGTREGWWNWGGITRPVSLVSRGPVVLHDAGVLPRRTCTGATCRWETIVDGWLENRSARPQRPDVRLTLRSPDGTISTGGASPRMLRPGERVRVRYTVPVRGAPKLWDPEHPRLYDATVRTLVGGRVVQMDPLRIGLRTVSVVNGALRLNGRVLDLRGASIQEDTPGRGPALTDADIETTVQELKSLGANVTRAHYLLDERLLRRFDEEGILVWSQAPVYHRDAMLRTPGQRSFELDDVRNTILSARNHPSVITHSVANELSPQPDEVKTTRLWMRNAAALARDLDPTLPVSIDVLSYPGVPRQRTYDAFDMLGINSYYGWYEGKPDRSTANLADLEPYLRAMHAKYPRQALVMTEFGAEANEAGPADVKQTYAFQSRYLEQNLDIIDRLGFMGGAIYWTAREFAVKPHWDGGAQPLVRDSIHNKALIAYDGTPKPAFKVARAAFRATPLYRDDPAAVARAELSESTSIVTRTLLVIGALALIAGLLVLDAICLRDIWRHRPQDAPVVELRRRPAA